MKNILPPLLLIILSLLVVYYYNLNVNEGLEGCYGMHTGIINIFLFLLGLGLLILTAFTIFSDGLLSKQAKLICTGWLLLLPVAVALLQPIRAARHSRAIWLRASGGNQLELILREDQSFTLARGLVEASCYHSGRYERKNDTIRLSTPLDPDFEEDFAASYRLQDSLLLPLEEDKDSLQIE